jgi:di/tricarboxylate transporter
MQVIVAFCTFGAVILLIALDWLDMTVAAMLGVVVFTVTGILTESAVASAIEMSGGTIALLFGGMVVARVLVPTGIFDVVGAHFLRFTAGNGKRLLLGLIVLVAPLCAFLPNATIVLLIAPVIVRVAKTLKVVHSSDGTRTGRPRSLDPGCSRSGARAAILCKHAGGAQLTPVMLVPPSSSARISSNTRIPSMRVFAAA